ncbi:MFS general substrate transporter [Polychaeton citri CBS 116435]|uniref:Cercosporin MFS transporter CTB4 n=1 Tax=Polychaeton citri CBS 116435 TaxID=1314669 RepID=A0A9P4QG33_9PEZI|nr:MFS general substrate transporter [Polychaeton citri CBS 116435]
MYESQEDVEKASSSGTASAASSVRAASVTAPIRSNGLTRIATAASTASERAIQASFEPDNEKVKKRYSNHHALPVSPDSDSDLDPNIVDWEGPDDPENPRNWPEHRKWTITLISAAQCFVVSFASSVWSTATEVTAEEFHVSREVMTLGVAVYVAGFAAGPLFFGPVSEAYGRIRPIVYGFLAFAIFQIPVAVATNLQTIFVCRFFAGCFGSAPLAIDPGLFVDMFDHKGRGTAMAVYAAAIFVGPAMGPIIGEFTVKNESLGWRWTAWFTLIMAAFFWVLCLPFFRETMAPLLLQRKAAKLRAETKNWALHSKLDEQPIEMSRLVKKYGLKPFQMLFREPILVVMTVYISLVYGILYLTFASFPMAFSEIRGWKPGVAALPFIGVMLGNLFANGMIVVETRTRFEKTVARNNGVVVPEQRLPLMMVGSIVLMVGLFWFGWCSHNGTSWAPQVISTFFIGAGIQWVFIPGLIYLTDVYLFESNSALAANALARSLLAAGFTMFSIQLFRNLGVDWGMSLLGFLCLALMPFPVLFWFKGKQIRSYSKFAYQVE